jgi:hypothetical protein
LDLTSSTLFAYDLLSKVSRPFFQLPSSNLFKLLSAPHHPLFLKEFKDIIMGHTILKIPYFCQFFFSPF